MKAWDSIQAAVLSFPEQSNSHAEIMMSHRFAILSLLLFLAGCMSVNIPREWDTKFAAMRANRGDLAQLVYQDFPESGNIYLSLDEKAPVFQFEMGKSVYAAYRLPNWPRPLSLELVAASKDTFLVPGFSYSSPPFRPMILLLDADHHLLTAMEGDREMQLNCGNGIGIEETSRYTINETKPTAVYMVILTSETLRKQKTRIPSRRCTYVPSTLEITNYSPFGQVKGTMSSHIGPDDDIYLIANIDYRPYTQSIAVLRQELNPIYSEILFVGKNGLYVSLPVQGSPAGKGWPQGMPTYPYDKIDSITSGTWNAAYDNFIDISIKASPGKHRHHDTFVFQDSHSVEAVMAAIAPHIQHNTSHENIGLIAAHWNPAFSFEHIRSKGAMGRIGDAAMEGGAVLASPCGLCQVGGCGPEVLVPCAGLFASGAVIGAVVGIGNEMSGGGFSAKARQTGIPTAAARETAPRIEKSSQAALNQQRLLRSFLDEIEHRRPEKATYDWKAEEREASITLLSLPGSESAEKPASFSELRGQVYDYVIEISLQRILLTPESAKGKVDVDSPVALKLEGGVRLVTLASGETTPLTLMHFQSEAKPLSAWASEDGSQLRDALNKSCKNLAEQMVKWAEQTWREQ